jgi:Lrp/AsnC family leucine-responsive transcriptional regulator
MPSMDDTDRRLLTALAGSGRMTLAALGERVGLSAPSVHERVHRLEQTGVISGYAALVEPGKVGASTAALVFLRCAGGPAELARMEHSLGRDPAVLELHEVAGEDCYVAKVRVESTAALADFLHQLRERHPGLTTRSSVVLRSCFERPLMGPAPTDGTAAGESPSK